MNKLRYRLVFNKLRGQQMVVAETARAAGKSAGSDGNLPAPGQSPVLRQLARLLAQTFSVSMLCVAGTGLAQVVGDPGVPGGQRPTVLNAANGITLVNIQTASSAGVSRNSYTQFDVPKGGVILNNSRTETQTQLGGWVQANPWLAQGQARVILNEVNSSNPSRLQGFIEVAGPRAEVIIANPSGISVDGGGFINVSRATLTTGSARFNEGHIDGFTVARGRIGIDGAGLDASSTDYTALIARSVAVNAALWANQLNVLTGPGEVTVTGSSLSIAGAAASDGKPTYAIDVGQLGGMYANKIFLVGTEAGVGVRNAGSIGAAAGELVVTSDGRLENSGQMTASAQLHLNGRAIANSGSIASDGIVKAAGETVRNSGAIRSATMLQVAAQDDIDNSAGTLEAARLDLGSASGSLVNRGGRIRQNGIAGLDLTSATLRNQDAGQIGAPTPAAGSGPSLHTGTDTGVGTAPAGGTTVPASGIVVTAPELANGAIRVAHAIDNSAGEIGAGGVIALAASAIDNSGGKLYLRELAFNGSAFINRAGTLEVARRFSVTAPLFDNAGGNIVLGGALDASVGAFSNTSGMLRASSVRIDAGALIDNNGGTVASDAALALSATGDFSNRGGTVTGQGPSVFTFGAKVDNSNGTIQTLGPLTFSASGALNNKAGAIVTLGANNTFDLYAGAIDSDGGRLVNSGAGATRIAATSTLFNSGTISAGGTLDLAAATLRNANGNIATGSGLVFSADGIDNSGVISSGGTLTYARPGASLRNSGSMVAAGAMRLAIAGIDNDGGQLATVAGSGSALMMGTGTLSNRGGAIMADGSARITAAGSVDNAAGLVQGASDVTLGVAGVLANTGGAIEVLAASGQLSVHAGAIDNHLGRIVNAGVGETRVDSAGSLSNAGLIQGAGAMAVIAASMQQSASGQLLSGSDMQLTVSQRFDNAGAIGSHGALDFDGAVIINNGQLIAAGPVAVRAAIFDNDRGQIATTQNTNAAITITATSFSNQGGSISADGAIDATATGAFDNNGGTLQSARDMHLVAGGILSNDGGTIEAVGASLDLSAGSLRSMAGRILQVGSGNASIASASSFINSGVVASNGTLAFKARTLDNLAGGSFASAATLDLNIADVLHNAGSLASNGALTFSQASATFDNTGAVSAGGAMTFNIAHLRNDGGTIATDGDFAVQAGSVSNRAGAIQSQGAAGLVSTGAVDNTDGLLRSNDDLVVQVGGLLGNNSGTIETGGAASTLQLQAGDIDSAQGRIVNAGGGNTTIHASGNVVNGGLIGANGGLHIEAAGFDNRSGATVSAGHALVVTARQLDNAGVITGRSTLALNADTIKNSGQALSDAAITVHAGLLNNDDGHLATTAHSGAGIDVVAASMLNRGGSILADSALNLAASGAVDNSAGRLRANTALVLEAGVLKNAMGTIDTLADAATLSIHALSIGNDGGRISNAGNGATVIASAGDLSNSGDIQGGGALALSAQSLSMTSAGRVGSGADLLVKVDQAFTNAGVFGSQGSLHLDAGGATVNNSGQIVSSGAATILAAQLSNDGGQIATAHGLGADLTVVAGTIRNTGKVLADGAATITSSAALDNHGGGIEAGRNLTLTAGGALNNDAGEIDTLGGQAGLTIGAHTISNAGGKIVNAGGGATSISSLSSFLNSGQIGGNGAVLLAATTMDNQLGGTISAASGLDFGVTDSLMNAGTIGSNGALTFNQSGASFDNSGVISVAGPVTLRAHAVSNRNGTIEALGSITLASGTAGDNTHGTVRTAGDLAFTVGAGLLNDGGTLETTGQASNMQVLAGAISNLAGRIANAGLGATTVASGSGLVNSGLVAGNGVLAIDALELDNRSTGVMSAGAGLLLTSGQQLNNAGVISAHDALNVHAANAVMTNSGQIVAGATATIVAGILRNDGGQIATSAGSGADVLVTAHTVTNVSGIVLADRDVVLAAAGRVDNHLGFIQAGNSLQLTAGGALNNTGGTIEDGGAAAVMHVAAQSIDNAVGRIVNAGTGFTSIVANTSLTSSGVIAGNGAVSVQAMSMDNQGGATLSAGAALDLVVTQRFANHGTVSSAGALHFNQASAEFANSGTMVAGADVTVTASAIDNSGGHLVTIENSGAALQLNAVSIVNRNGRLLADGSAALASGAGFDNTGGTIQAGSNLSVTAADAVSNDGGAIETLGAAATLHLDAGVLANGTGRISNSGNGATTVSSQSGLINNGLIAGNGSMTLSAATLVNQALGSIGSAGNMELGVWQQFENQGQVSSAGTLNFNQAGAGFNNSGKIASNAAMTITAAAINNSGGQLSTVRGAGGDIVLDGALVNHAGQVLADGNVTLHIAGNLDNTFGTLQAGKALSVDISGALVNAGGSIEALGTASALNVQASAVDNTGGRIVNLGNGDTRLTSAGSIVNSGIIGGNGNVSLSGHSLVNGAAGSVSAGTSLDLQIDQRLENRGTINSAGTMTFNQGAAQLVNSGEIGAGNTMLVNVAGIDNRGGRISTGLGSSADLELSAVSINNESGRIVADRDLMLSAGQLLGAGEAGAGRDLSASLQGDFTHTVGAPRFTAQRDLALSVSGNFTNAATFAAVRNLTLSAATVNNLQGAAIEAQGLTIRPTGGLTNGGDINGAAFLDIATSGNIANTGAMFGNALSLAANSISNDGATALLGATNAMQLLAADNIDNRGGATIYSAGWLAAQTGTLNNLSSTVESGGDMAIAANTINNIRENVQIVQAVVADNTTHMTLPSWYRHGDNNNEYDPNSANYRPQETYFVNPSDIISDTTFVTPDGYTIGRVVYTAHANDSAFFAAGSGAYGKYGHRERIATSDGTRTMYYLVKDPDVANPDQGGASGNGNPLFDSTTMQWDGPAVSFSGQYGSCSTTCVRYTTLPGYDDPANTIALNTVRELAPSRDRLEIYRDAHHVAVEDSLAPGAGAVARIVAGGNMHLTVSQLLNNQYSDVIASGFLTIDGAGSTVNTAATLYRRHTFDGTWTTENHTVTAYTMPSIAEVIGSVNGVISGSQGVSITGHSFSNIDVTAGTVGIVRSSVQVLGSGASGAVSAGSGAAASGVGSQAGLQDGFAGQIVNDAASVDSAASSWNGTASGATHMLGGASQASTAALSGFQNGANQTTTGAAVNASAVAVAGQVANVQGSGLSRLAAATLHGAQSAGANRASAVSTTVSGTPVGVEATIKPGAGSVLTIAPSGLFIKNPDANGKYLFETRSQFANLNDWASSDYLLSALGMDPALMQKRLGDGFYEQRIVREQLNELTGRAPANGASDDSVYQALLGSAVSFAKAYNLRPGIALTADQVSRLTSDIVWMESQQVRLPDGSLDTVLVPKVYLAHLADGAVTKGGALVTGGGAGVLITTDADIVNRGGVIDGGSGRTLLISGQDILNQGGTIRGGNVLVAAARDVRNESLASTQTYSSANTSGSYTALSNQAAIVAIGVLEISAGRDISDVAGHINAASASLSAARDVTFNALATGSTYTAQVGADAQKNLTVGHALNQVNTTGNLVVSAGRDLTLNGGQLAIGGDGALVAGRALTVASVMDQVRTDEHGDGAAKQYDKRASDEQQVVGSNIGAGGTLQLAAGTKETAALTVSSSALAAVGALSLNATGDVLIGGVQENSVLDNASHHESSSTFKSKSSTTSDYVADSNLIGSSVSGSAVAISSGHDIKIVGSSVVADLNVDLVAKNAVTITAGTNTSTESHHSEIVESGFLSGGGGFGISYGKRTTTTDQKQDATVQSGQARSLVGSLGGSLNVIAGERIQIAGSDVSAAKDITLIAKSVSITAGKDQVDGSFATKRTQDGLTLAVGGSVVNAIQTVQSMGSVASATSNGRVKALAAATAAKASSDAAKDMAQNGLSISVSLTAGHSESEQKQTTASTAHFGSTVNAGNDVTIIATGGGKASNIDVIGSDIGAKHNVLLFAENQVNLLSAQDKDSQHSVSKSLSAAVGVAASYSSNGGMAAGFIASVGGGRGTEDGEGITQINAHVSAGEKLSINSGGDTNIKGAVASGAQVVANVGGHLNIESLQDKATFDSKSVSANASVIVGYGASVSGSVNASKIKSDYASVQEQSGLRAGDGGFQVNVAGNTDLKGAVISSTAKGAAASSLVTGTLTHSDIDNYAKMNAASFGMGGSATLAGTENGGAGGAGQGVGGSNLIGFKKTENAGGISGVAATTNNESSVTRSGVGASTLLITDNGTQISRTGLNAAASALALNRDVITGLDGSSKLGNSFDATRVKATLAIASSFSAIAAKSVGDYAAVKLAEAQTLFDSAKGEVDPSRRAQLYQQAQNIRDNWSEGGVAKVALHAAVGGLTGGVDGAFGAGAAALATNAIARRLENLDVPESVKKALILSAGAAIGAVAGGEAGALTSLNEIDNNYLSHKRPAGFGKLSEQEQFEKAVAACTSGDNSACQTRDRWIAISQTRDQLLTSACAVSSSGDCGALINQANAAGNKVIFDNKGSAVVYKLGSPELVASPGVGEGSFHYTLAKSTLEGIEYEAVGGAGSTIIGWGAKAIGYMRAGFLGAEKVAMVGTSNEVIAARQQLAAVAKFEPQVTQTLSELATFNGGDLVGLQYRLKSVESLSRKMADQPGVPINDALRYTMRFDEANFTESTKATMADLQNQGYKSLVIRNTFKDGQPYKGINSTFLTPEGEMFELQFHTQESFKMKDIINHPLYEQQRLLPLTGPTWTNLRNQMIQNSSSVPNPPGVTSIKKTR